MPGYSRERRKRPAEDDARVRKEKGHDSEELSRPSASLTPEVAAQALTDRRFSPTANLGRKAQVLLGLQQSHGNTYV